MPVLSMFYGVIITMYYFDNQKHQRPHIHVKYQDDEAVIGIPEGDVIEVTMSPKVIQVEPQVDYHLRLQFDNGEVRLFDVRPYLDRGIFTELQSVQYFQQVKPFFGGVQWPNEQDFSPDTLYLTSVLLSETAIATMP